MKKEYSKPSMIVTCYDATDMTNMQVAVSAISLENKKLGRNMSSQSYSVTQLG